jgi:uncharacterized protein
METGYISVMQNDGDIESYKKSSYIVSSCIDHDVILFNTFTGGIIKIDKKEIAGLNSSNYEDIIYKLSEKRTDYRDVLIKNGFFIKEYINEFNIIKTNYYIKKYQRKYVAITINTGLICNCRCEYCYEGKSHSIDSILKKEKADDIIAFIKRQFSKEIKISVTFIGGEPLICIEQIQYMYYELKKYFNDIKCSIITNGLLLNKEIALFIKEITDENIQISIDGPKNYHNKKRKAINGEDTYNKLLLNIKILQELDIPINIRVHIDDKFIKNVNILSWIEDIKKDFNINKKIRFYLAPIVKIGKGTRILDKKYVEYIIDVYNRFIENNISIVFSHIFKPITFLCAVDTFNSFSIDSDGEIYKCWHDLTISNFNNNRFGNIYKGINIAKIINYISKIDINENIECKQCKFLPLCYGGCPEYISSGYNKCTILKDYYSQLLSLFIKMNIHE